MHYLSVKSTHKHQVHSLNAVPKEDVLWHNLIKNEKKVRYKLSPLSFRLIN